MSESPASTWTVRKVHSEKERARKLDQIDKAVGRGDTIKSAIKKVGISEQTYYQWKNAAASASGSGDLKDLLALEEENKRLKKLLAKRFRKENSELKKSWGWGRPAGNPGSSVLLLGSPRRLCLWFPIRGCSLNRHLSRRMITNPATLPGDQPTVLG